MPRESEQAPPRVRAVRPLHYPGGVTEFYEVLQQVIQRRCHGHHRSPVFVHDLGGWQREWRTRLATLVKGAHRRQFIFGGLLTALAEELRRQNFAVRASKSQKNAVSLEPTERDGLWGPWSPRPRGHPRAACEGEHLVLLWFDIKREG